MNTRPGPSAATLLISFLAILAIKPSTEKITKPDSMLVKQLIALVIIASLKKRKRERVKREELVFRIFFFANFFAFFFLQNCVGFLSTKKKYNKINKFPIY